MRKKIIEIKRTKDKWLKLSAAGEVVNWSGHWSNIEIKNARKKL